MNTEDNLHLSKIERQVGTLKLAVLILGAALIFNSANKSGLLGEYKFVADKIEVKKIILKNSREVVGKIYYDELIGTVIELENNNQLISINPNNIKFLEKTDIDDKVLKTISP